MTLHTKPRAQRRVRMPADVRRMIRARAKLEERIHELVALLDSLDVDPDLEEGGDEEWSLGWVQGTEGSGEAIRFGFAGDVEQDAGDEGEVCEEGEPILGAPESPASGSQLRWSQGCNWGGGEMELDRSDWEPTLGWPGHGYGFDPDYQSVVDASMRSDDHEDGHDAEGHTDDNGIGDMAGLEEQMQREGRDLGGYRRSA